MRIVMLAALVAGCGRLAFDPIGDADSACPPTCTPASDPPTYCYCPNPATWDAARRDCEASGASLLRIDDASENAFARGLSELLGLPSADNLWVGGSDLGTEDTWQWSDGTVYWLGDFTGASVGGAFTAWGPGQPNNAGGDEDCMVLLTNREWNDTECSRAHAYMCKK